MIIHIFIFIFENIFTKIFTFLISKYLVIYNIKIRIYLLFSNNFYKEKIREKRKNCIK